MNTQKSMTSAASSWSSPLKWIHIGLRIIVIVSAAIVALCAIIALSKVDINSIHAEFEIVSSHPELLKYALNSNTLICGSLFLLACGGTLLYQIILLIVSFASKDQNTKVLSIVETVLGSIGAVMYFSISIGLANSVNEVASRSRGLELTHPLIMPGQATAAFGFLTSFAIIGLITFLWIKFCIEKSRADA